MKAKAYAKKTRFVLWGFGVTGRALANVLISRGYKVTVIDDRPESQFKKYTEDIARLGNLGVKFNFEEPGSLADFIRREADVLSPSPGIKVPQAIQDACDQSRIQIAGEIEIASRLIPGKIIAVTGTDGKTTTATLVHHILTSCGLTSHLVGNIGTPFIQLDGLTDPEHWLVVEVSSYQLESVRLFRPYIALILNIAEDHLERHGDMRGYIRAKSQIFNRQRTNDHAIVNFDDPLAIQVYGQAKSKLYGFSLAGPLPVGAYKKDDSLMLNTGKGEEKILDASELKIIGEHNELNVLASAYAARLAGCTVDQIAEALKTFEGLEHRIEFVGEFDGVSWVNDSKATNMHSTSYALRCFDRPVVLILGGYDKGFEITELIPYINRHAKHVILMGDTRNRFKKALREIGYSSITVRKTLQEACLAAHGVAVAGDVILLSPASSSFDQFSSFVERGDAFKKWVLKKHERKDQ